MVISEAVMATTPSPPFDKPAWLIQTRGVWHGMGMDLFSKQKPRNKDKYYYRFNWTGWGNVTEWLDGLGCDLTEFSGNNDGKLVSPKSCLAIADKIQEYKDYLKKLMTEPAEELLLKMHADAEIEKQILATRLKDNKPLDVSLLEHNENGPWVPWGHISYYLGFGDFCRKCSKLGGFQQF